MKIDKIENIDGIYKVTRVPNFIEKLFGVKSRVDSYKSTGATYTYGGGRLYIDKDRCELGNNMGYGSSTREAIDRWRRKF